MITIWSKTVRRAIIFSTVCSLTAASTAFGAISPTAGTPLPGTNTTVPQITNTTTQTPVNNPVLQPPKQLRYDFPDVAKMPPHWALKYITKLALLGIVEGDDYGQYKPEDAVTQEQVIAMAIRMMGLEQEALNYRGSFAVAFDVQDYARPYLRMAIEKGLVDPQEETVAAGVNGSKWGSRPASREWVAKVVIRAIGMRTDALNLSNVQPAFTDAKSITPSAIGYINLAVSKGIVNGFEDNTFRPTEMVTRAQMAAFLGRSDKYMAILPARAVKGYIAELGANKIVIQNELGMTQEFLLQNSTIYYSGKDDRRMAVQGLQASNEVYLIQDNGYVYYVEVTNDEVPMEEFEGKLIQTNMSDLTIKLEINGQEQQFKLNADASVVKPDGTGAGLAQLTPGSILQLKRNKIIANAGISAIVVKREPVIRSFEGFFQKINGQQLLITNKVNTATETLTISPETVVTYQGLATTAADLYEGDHLKITVVDDLVQSIEITFKAVDAVDRGKLVSIDYENRILNLEKADGKLVAYRYTALMNVVMDGLAYATVRDLSKDDSIVVEIKDNAVVRTKISNRSVQSNLVTTIINYDRDNKWLTVKDVNGNPDVYIITDQTTFEYENRAMTLSEFIGYLAKDKRVELSVSQKNIRSVRMTTSYEGKVVGKSVSELVLQTATGQQMSFKLSGYPYVQLAGKPMANYDDVKQGDEVKLQINADTGTVLYIQLKASLTLRVTNKVGSYVTVANTEGSTFGYELGHIKIAKDGFNSPTHSDVQINDYVVMDFTGTQLEKATVLIATLGKVTAVDASTGRLNLMTFGGMAQNLTMGSSTKVEINKASSSLNQVKVGDRVETVRDINGNYLIRVIPVELREVNAYDVNTKKLTFMRKDINEKEESFIVEFAPGAYIHKNGERVEPYFLMKNEKVNVYMLDGKIVELERR
jgi:trimeric autotransporter adhesin